MARYKNRQIAEAAPDNYNLHVIDNPAGTYHFVGSVPWSLMYDASGILPQEYSDCHS